ncbi:class I SAM-dependent methyltransferase [Phytoactinopolyspora mesophila]|uniref:Methyltransferase domain-containing protein n=1 Tax=Phytoactinopolyspora mesophila TaxID=2650750 RepID=A0A7K3LY13_9ACTN|nr:class I SAM-dependent methyltransferase [Phytoactinopolyspora mesophila]NDL55870.1 methyltransferase domain-containing protein [Phytoactinopolyspora mesophila]
MIYEHPLAYLLGLEGTALMRAFVGGHDREFVEARIAEVRRLIDDERLADAGVEVERVDSVEGYRLWSRTYDDGRNAAFDLEEPIVREILDQLRPGVALDAACGTGRYAEYLVKGGHQVIGVDSSPDMLAKARERVPGARFQLGDLGMLPLADNTVDVVVCALALTHVADLGPAMAEFARVLRPGGHLITSDMHRDSVSRGAIPPVIGPNGERGRLSAYQHLGGDYLRAALPVGLQVRRCEEPRLPESAEPERDAEGDDDPLDASNELPPWHEWPWALVGLVPEAARAVGTGTPRTIIWHFELTGV